MRRKLTSDQRGISKICFGCEPLGGTDWGEVDVQAVAEAVERALDLGIDFFDTAAVYGLGLSEERLSGILGSRRHEVVIATKGGLVWRHPLSGGRAIVSRDSSPIQLRWAVETSLRRLRLDRIPLYYIHWPDPNTEIRDTFEALNQLQREEKIGYIGCSNFSSAQIRSACEVSDVSFVQLPVNLLGNGLAPDMVNLLLEKSVSVVAYNVLANGLLTGKYDENSKFREDDRRSRLPLFRGDAYRTALRKVADVTTKASARGLTTAQYAIDWVLSRPYVVSALIGIKNCNQIEENSKILSLHA
jgi:myo-inositol catabolism protein IolS